MRHPLDGVNAKLRWAQKHLDDLASDIEQRALANEYGIRAHVDPATRQLTRYVFVPYDLRVEWGLRAGDVVHALRSALDHLAVQLVDTNGGTLTPSTAFPVYSSVGEYRKQKGVKKVEGARKSALAVIEALQPKTADDPLWTLRCLDNSDKHDLVHVAAIVAGLGGIEVYVMAAESWSIHNTHVTLDSIEDGADLYTMTIAERSDMDVKMSPSVEVTFSESGPGKGHPVVPLLAELVEYVGSGIVPKFGLAKRKPTLPTWHPPG